MCSHGSPTLPSHVNLPHQVQNKQRYSMAAPCFSTKGWPAAVAVAVAIFVLFQTSIVAKSNSFYMVSVGHSTSCVPPVMALRLVSLHPQPPPLPPAVAGHGCACKQALPRQQRSWSVQKPDYAAGRGACAEAQSSSRLPT